MRRLFTRGFTLIELLVVIAIIGILSTVVLSSLSTARTKAQDARVKADVRQIQLAMQLYYDDHGYYPSCPGAAESCCVGSDSCSITINGTPFNFTGNLSDITAFAPHSPYTMLAAAYFPHYGDSPAYIYSCRSTITVESNVYCAPEFGILMYPMSGGQFYAVRAGDDQVFTTSPTGCIDPTASNFNPYAVGSGACNYEGGGETCNDSPALNYEQPGPCVYSSLPFGCGEYLEETFKFSNCGNGWNTTGVYGCGTYFGGQEYEYNCGVGYYTP